ncbi:MAG: protein translocase subunit SecD [Coriobacteriia bacterium]|nr:protein translocase subunit SecD [Coriobacteriia bacterium]
MDPRQRNVLFVAAMVVLAALAWWQFWPPGAQIRQGLDIQGGVSVILTAEEVGVTQQQMARVETVMLNRVNGLGVSEATVQRQGDRSLLVQLPGVRDVEGALEALGSTGRLEFVDVASLPATVQAGIEEGAQIPEGTPYEPVLTGEVIQRAAPGTDDLGRIVVNLSMDRRGAEAWAQYTGANVGERVAIVLDGTVQSAPQIRERIPTGETQISGDFTPEEARRLAAVLEAGALPVSLEFSESRVVGPTLGQESLRQGLLAGLAGLGLVAVYMLAVYRGLGVLSWVSLGVFGSIFLGILAVMSKAGVFTLTLPGIAGIVLTVGLAADSAILMFERFKEEVRLGKTARSAAVSGTRHAYGTNLDGDLVTFVTALVLYVLSIGPVRGFALTLMIGLAVDLFVAWFLTRPAMILIAESAASKTPWLLGLRGGGTRA